MKTSACKLIMVSLISLGYCFHPLLAAEIEKPLCVSLTVNGDPTSRMGFTWFTNESVKSGKVEIFESGNVGEGESPLQTVLATAQLTDSLNYANSKTPVAEELKYKKVVYMTHKAVVENLTPNTLYYYRVGSDGAWSDIGSFLTAPKECDSFSFIYVTDMQSSTDYTQAQRTVHAAAKMMPEAAFILCNGDLVESRESEAAEWEYQQWFETMQDVWQSYPLAITKGNHDINEYNNYKFHFNTNNDFAEAYNADEITPGTTYSYRWGNALFMVVNFIENSTPAYLTKVADWMRDVVAQNPDATWRIVCSHNSLFTGSTTHQNEGAAKRMRTYLLPVFADLKIDLSIEGHDHIYQVIGPVSSPSVTVAKESVFNVITESVGGELANMTGKADGTYDVTNGTLYFLNGSCGPKNYVPRNREQMMDAYESHGVSDYWNLFTGRLAQVGSPTFSKVSIEPASIKISTYTVKSDSRPRLYDEIELVKSGTFSTSMPEIEFPLLTDTTQDNGLYTLSGLKVNSAIKVSKGIYIRKQGADYQKISVVR